MIVLKCRLCRREYVEKHEKKCAFILIICSKCIPFLIKLRKQVRKHPNYYLQQNIRRIMTPELLAWSNETKILKDLGEIRELYRL